MKFIDRDEELDILKRRLGPTAEFVVVYGRRRVGKTELIHQFLKSADGIYLLGRHESSSDHLKRFSEIIANKFDDEVIRKNPFRNWDALLEYLYENSKKRGFIIVLDEFPYIASSEPKLPSIIQDYWDNKLRGTKIFLILCGSNMGMMEKEVLGYKSPLYGRRTAQLLIKPFSFKHAQLFFPNYNLVQKVGAFAILGGTPAYLMQFSDEFDVFANIKEKILRRDSFLFQDAIFVLREELAEPRFYFSILRSIASGNVTVGRIVNDVGLAKGVVGKYIGVLIDLDILKRTVPITEKHPEKSRKGTYSIKDNFFRFWFRFVYPNLEGIEMGKSDEVLERKIKPFFDQYISSAFEEICKESLPELLKREKVPFGPSKVGKWWHKDEEIDIVGLNEEKKQIAFFECKWRRLKEKRARGVLKELETKSALVDWFGRRRAESYGLIAKSVEGKENLVKEGYSIFELDDLAEILG